MSLRDEFEKLFPPNESDAERQDALWLGFQAGHAAGLEDAAAICDNADKSAHPADLADAIRAMKEQKK